MNESVHMKADLSNLVMYVKICHGLHSETGLDQFYLRWHIMAQYRF